MKSKIVTVSFIVIVFAIFCASLIKPAQELSYSERRRLAQLPKLTAESLIDGKYMEGFDKYTSDQFVGREQFRGIKMFVDRNVMQKRDTNGLFQVGGSIFSTEYPLDESKVLQMCGRMNALYDRYLQGMNVYFSIIPDKNYYLPNDGSHMLMDYGKLESLMLNNMPENAQYIDMFDVLTLSNYYNSDGHWRQETIKPVVDAVNSALGNNKSGKSDSGNNGSGNAAPENASLGNSTPGNTESRNSALSSSYSAFDPAQYDQKDYYPFYGVYYGQLAGMAQPDTIVWLENKITQDAIVTSLSHPGRDDLPVYYEDGLGGMDSYDVYLHGAQPLITIENPHNTSRRELILFRDSYGSSLAPLLLDDYSRITLVDLRYITQELLADYIEFNNQDILLMYSTTIINNSDIIR